jgi:hypothetical protein
LATIDAQHQSRLFDVESSGKTILDHLTLTNGTAPNSFDSDGGAIFNGSDLTLSNDLLNNNTTYGGTTGSHGAGGAVFTNGSKLTVTNTTFDHNTAQGGSDSNTNGGGAEGGAICAISGTVTITASTFSNNQAIGGNFTGEGSSSGGNAYGGAVEIRQESNIHLKIVNSTFAQNSAYGGHSTAGTSYGGVAYGGAIANGNISGSDNTVTLINDTIAFNHVFGGEGGGVANFGATSDFSSENTIIAKNTNVSGFSIVGPDVIGDFNSLGNNLIGNGADSFGFSALLHHDQVGTTAHPIDPKLGSLTFNGGPTKTLALLAGSPAIDKGNNNALIITGANDQRGAPFSRIVNGIIDIGAFEVQTSRGRLLVHH